MRNLNDIKSYILHSEAERNVLPLSPLCHNGCVFCSHKNISPSDPLYGFYDYRREVDEIIEHIEFLDPSKRVFIGESATKIFEGEPFMFKGIMRILSALRKHVKKAPISITTSGGFIPPEFFEAAAGLAPLEINYSLNSYDERTRDGIVLDGRTRPAFENLERLCAAGPGIDVSVSLMAVCEALTPVAGLRDGIEKLRRLPGVGIIKIYLPRFSRAQFGKFFNGRHEFDAYRESVISSLAGINGVSAAPVVIEPAAPSFDGGDVLVHSVVPGSKAAAKNIGGGDKIISVNGERPLSRTHAHALITASKKSTLSITVEPASGGAERRIEFADYRRGLDGACGMVFTSDISPSSLKCLAAIDEKLKKLSRRGIMATTILSLAYMNAVIEKFEFSSLAAEAFESFSFGGNIDCAGLLTAEDIRRNLASFSRGRWRTPCADSALVLPAHMFDHLGRDLNGEHIADLARETRLEIFTA